MYTMHVNVIKVGTCNRAFYVFKQKYGLNMIYKFIILLQNW